MPYRVFDYRHDITNMFVTPQIRSRFMKMKPGEIAGRHSHDLGHEVFLILQGQCEMEIDGEKAVLTPGQMCVAFNHQMHQARNVGDEPMVMYLSVTPHVFPTHTQYDRRPESGCCLSSTRPTLTIKRTSPAAPRRQARGPASCGRTGAG